MGDSTEEKNIRYTPASKYTSKKTGETKIYYVEYKYKPKETRKPRKCKNPYNIKEIDPELIQKIKDLYIGGMPKQKISRELNVTYYKIQKILNNE